MTDKLELKKLCTKIVPKFPTQEQKLSRKECYIDRKNSVAIPGFLERVITDDECWFYDWISGWKPKTKSGKQKGVLKQNETRMNKSKVEVMLIIFIDVCGIVHRKCLPRGQTVISNFYVAVLIRFRDRVRRFQSNLRREEERILHHNNASTHSFVIVGKFLTQISSQYFTTLLTRQIWPLWLLFISKNSHVGTALGWRGRH